MPVHFETVTRLIDKFMVEKLLVIIQIFAFKREKCFVYFVLKIMCRTKTETVAIVVPNKQLPGVEMGKICMRVNYDCSPVMLEVKLKHY